MGNPGSSGVWRYASNHVFVYRVQSSLAIIRVDIDSFCSARITLTNNGPLPGATGTLRFGEDNIVDLSSFLVTSNNEVEVTGCL